MEPHYISLSIATVVVRVLSKISAPTAAGKEIQTGKLSKANHIKVVCHWTSTMYIADKQRKQKKQIIPPPPASESEVDTSPGSQARKFQVQPDPPSLIPPLQADDDVWQLVCAERPKPRRKVFFVGRLHVSITYSQLESYIVRRAAKAGLEIQVASVSVRSPGSQEPESCASARVSVNAVDAYVLRQPNFGLEKYIAGNGDFNHMMHAASNCPPDTPTPVTQIGLKISFRKSIKMLSQAERTSRYMSQIYPSVQTNDHTLGNLQCRPANPCIRREVI